MASDNTATGVTRIYSDDASSGSAWTLAGTPNPPLWHRTERRSNSPAHAWWYGREASGKYDTGAANWGTLTTSFDLTGYAEAALAFSEWSQVEVTATLNRTRVQASTDGTAWITVFESHGTSGAWAQRVVDVTAYAGQRMQLRFYYFETRDPVLNDFEGWYVDDVKVIGLQPTGFVADFTATVNRRIRTVVRRIHRPIVCHRSDNNRLVMDLWRRRRIKLAETLRSHTPCRVRTRSR